MKNHKIALATILAMAAATPFAHAAKGAGFDIQKDGPRIERGERINWEPKGVARDPSPVEKSDYYDDRDFSRGNWCGTPPFPFHKSFPDGARSQKPELPEPRPFPARP
jgi:hypothetical protein